MLFDTFVTTVWKPSCAKLRECTKVGYESALNCHILPQWSGRDMDAISVADIESWLDSFDKPGAARKAYAVFRAILLEGVNGQHGALSFDSGGKVTISGSMNSGYYFRVCGCWPVK